MLGSCFSSKYHNYYENEFREWRDTLTCMTTRRSALPVRMSYSVNVRSEPMLAKTLDSDMLKRTEVIVSVDVGNVRLDIGELLGLGRLANIELNVTDFLTLSRPRFELCSMP